MTNQTVFTIMTFYGLVIYSLAAAVVLVLKPGLWMLLLVTFLGFLVALVDRGSTEAQLTVLLLLVLGFFSGFAQPNRAWLWAVLLGVWIPILAIAAAIFGVSSSPVSQALAMFAVLVFPAAGAYAGVVAKRLAPRSVNI